MTYSNPADWDMFADIASITRWLDLANEESEHEDAQRVIKIGEEIGEAYEALALLSVANGRAVAAYIGMTGQNPRKGKTHTQADLCMELADVAITALCAIAHFTRGGYGTYQPDIMRGFVASKISGIISRADIQPLTDAELRAPRYRLSAMHGAGWDTFPRDDLSGNHTEGNK